MTVLNRLDRFHLVCDVLKYLQLSNSASQSLRDLMKKMLEEHHRHIRITGQDLPEVRDWRWAPL
jgi:xylulose-5-phosphate/fructose-6-phosphate phosphoketolase